MNEGFKVALILAVFSVCIVLFLYLISIIFINVISISFDKDNKSYVKWNRLNTVFMTSYLSENAKIKRDKLKLDFLKLLGIIALLILSFKFLE